MSRTTPTATGSGEPPRYAGSFEGDVAIGTFRNAMLITVHEDGTLTSSDANDFAGASHGQFNSPGYGAWRANGDGTTVFTVREFEYDSTGRFLGTSIIQGTGAYSADGTELSGTMDITTWRGQPGPAGVTYRLRRMQPGAH